MLMEILSQRIDKSLHEQQTVLWFCVFFVQMHFSVECFARGWSVTEPLNGLCVARVCALRGIGSSSDHSSVKNRFDCDQLVQTRIL